MKRRTLIVVLAGELVIHAVGVRAQQSPRVVRIGRLSPLSASGVGEDGLPVALREFGYIEGRNAVIERRWAEGRVERLSDLAAELVQLKVDVIVARGSEATQAALKATSTIPIVAYAGDPLGAGFVASLARPGGNVTAISQQGSDLAPKYLQLVRDVLPGVTEVAILWSPTNASSERLLRDTNDAAARSGTKIRAFAIATTEELEEALVNIERAHLHAMIVPSIPITNAHGVRLSEFAIKNRVATLSLDEDLVERGLLMSYGGTSAEQWRQIADYVDKILKGAKPGDLPVQQGTKFELILNLKTAKAIALPIPQSLLVSAHRVIQ